MIENNVDRQLSISHGRFLEEHSKVKYIHLDEVRSASFIDQLLSSVSPNELRQRLRRVLLPSGISYGRGPNIAALLATTLKFDLIHRRDSDVFADRDRPPIELELQVAGRTLEDLGSSVERQAEVALSPWTVVRMTGTGSYGSPTIDRRELAQAGLDFLAELQALGQAEATPAEVESDAFDYILVEPTRQYENDFRQIDIDNRVEMEACCSTGVCDVIPEMPTDILGCDYMGKDLVWRSGSGLVFHSRKVQHRFTPDRARGADLLDRVAYIVRDVQYLQIGRIWRRHTSQMQAIYSQMRGIGDFDAMAYAESFATARDESRAEIKQVRIGAERVYLEASRATLGTPSRVLAGVSRVLRVKANEIDEHVSGAIDDFCVLVENWHYLQERAAEVQVPTSWISSGRHD